MLAGSSGASSFKQGMFRRIPQSEKKRILTAMGEHRVPISVKGKNDEIFAMMTDGMQDDRFLQCRLILGSKKPDGDQPVVVNFTFGYERYFFQGFLNPLGDRYLIDASMDFYILQRRKAARMILPEEFPAAFNIISLNDKAVFFETKIIDFSSGGLKIHFPNLDETFTSGDKIHGALHLGIRRPVHLDATIRHVVRKEEGEKIGQTIGVQFQITDRILEVRLLTIFMDLQREIFLKYSK